MFSFSHSQESWLWDPKGGNGNNLTVTSYDSLAQFLLHFYNFGLCWSRDLCFQGRRASTREQNNGFIKLEVENATFLPWAPYTSEQKGEK